MTTTATNSPAKQVRTVKPRDYSSAVGRVVAEVIADAGLTRAQVARCMGISPGTLRGRLRGESSFTIDELVAFSSLAHVRVGDLIVRARAVVCQRRLKSDQVSTVES